MPHTLGTPKSFWGILKKERILQNDKKGGKMKNYTQQSYDIKKTFAKFPLIFFSPKILIILENKNIKVIY